MQYWIGQLQRLILASARVKRSTLVFSELLIAGFAAVLAFWLRLGTLAIDPTAVLTFYLISISSWLLSAHLFGVYKQIIRYAGLRTVFDTISASAVHGIITLAIVLFFSPEGIPRTVPAIYFVLFTVAVISMRAIMRLIIVDLIPGRNRRRQQRNVFIYGAGKAGKELAISMNGHPEMRLTGFFDDDHRLHGRKVDGIVVHSPHSLAEIVRTRAVDDVVLALPNISRSRRADIIGKLEQQFVHVRTVPDMSSMLSGKISVQDLRDVAVEDLLGREPVAPQAHLLALSITSKVVMITGAGGSIGSELARQAIKLLPRQIILVDISEVALFAIQQELLTAIAGNPDSTRSTELVAELCNCTDREPIARVMALYRPNTVFHAAAYKHVPMLEANPLSAARNNIFGTWATAAAASAQAVERFVLVSTDKAVRPTNIMGATKRVCELILQAFAERQNATIFTMVRFGNVLGSSGSVVPHFRRQIERGGPITITHRSITRYFMTIPEAATLVIQAGAMSRSGEVFLLDMGKPIQIMELAKTMIRLSGLTERNAAQPDGDIEIVETGLRPGEKLFEELLIDSNALPTAHSRIFCGSEATIPWDVLEPSLNRLHDALDAGDVAGVVALVTSLVPGYQPSDAFRSISGGEHQSHMRQGLAR